jgi:hypothetical protein
MGTTSDRSTGTALLAIAGALVLGVVLARCVDWLGHGHPKR